MNAEQLKDNLVKYTGYRCTNNQELKNIEDSILNSVASYFRPVAKDANKMAAPSKNLKEDLKKEVVLQELREMKQVSSNFYVDELVVNVMSKAHNDWILAHRAELENNDMKEPEKFVPFELLTSQDLKDYMRAVIPVFKCLNIDINEQEVIKAFTRKQLLFMIKYEIYSGENLIEKIMNIKNLNPEILETSSIEQKSIQELYANEDVAKNIAEHVKQRKNLNIADKFKEVFAQTDDVGFFTAPKRLKRKFVYRFSDNISQKKIGFKKHALPRIERPITKTIYQLARFAGVIFAKNVKTGDYKYPDYSYNSYQFVEYKDCSDEQKRAIDRREKRIRKSALNLEYNGNADIPGVISMVIVKKNPILAYKNFMDIDIKEDQRKTEIIQIPITQGELLKMNILPEEVGWEKEKKAKIQSSDKVVFAAPDKMSQEKNEFRALLVEMSQTDNKGDTKINMESWIREYRDNRQKSENER